MVETMSKLENQNNWMVSCLLKVNRDVLDVDRRIVETKEEVGKLHLWKQSISGKWAVVGLIGVILLSAGAKFMFEALWRLLKL